MPWSFGKVLDLIKHLPVPIIVIGTAGTASLIRVMRGSLLDELAKQYVVTARAKGVGERALLFRYPVRVAINPIISPVGWLLPEIVSGSTIGALVLSLPTIGAALRRRHFPSAVPHSLRRRRGSFAATCCRTSPGT